MPPYGKANGGALTAKQLSELGEFLFASKGPKSDSERACARRVRPEHGASGLDAAHSSPQRSALGRPAGLWTNRCEVGAVPWQRRCDVRR